MEKQNLVLGILRISMGSIFLWAFFDKLLGLGFATKPENSWLHAGSPTSGFLNFGVHGPLANIFKSISGNVFVDYLFMIGLLLIGICLILGIGMKIATVSGSLMLFLMYLALIPPANHPFLDDHIIYILVLVILYFTKAQNYLGLGQYWANIDIVKKIPVIA